MPHRAKRSPFPRLGSGVAPEADFLPRQSVRLAFTVAFGDSEGSANWTFSAGLARTLPAASRPPGFGLGLQGSSGPGHPWGGCPELTAGRAAVCGTPRVLGSVLWGTAGWRAPLGPRKQQRVRLEGHRCRLVPKPRCGRGDRGTERAGNRPRSHSGTWRAGRTVFGKRVNGVVRPAGLGSHVLVGGPSGEGGRQEGRAPGLPGRGYEGVCEGGREAPEPWLA